MKELPQRTKKPATEEVRGIEVHAWASECRAHRSTLSGLTGEREQEEKMNHILSRISVGLLSLAALVIVSPPVARAHTCTSANVAGDYGFTLTGTVVTPAGNISAAAIGRATVEPSGHVSGTEARSVGGDYADETFSGVLTVNSDCTG